MKKLMIATLGLAVAGSVFGDCAEASKETNEYPVYQFKASLKTTKGVALAGGAGSVCGEGGGANDIYRTKDAIKLSGWLYPAVDNCTCDGWALDGAEAVVWDTKRKANLDDAKFTFSFGPNVMGKKCTEAEAFWKLEGEFAYGSQRTQKIELYGAGMGTFSRKNATFSLSGNVAGFMGASYDLKVKSTKAEDAWMCQASQVSKCDAVWCDGDTMVDSDTVAYGTWSMKYNKSMSRKYTASPAVKSLTVPSYVTKALAEND